MKFDLFLLLHLKKVSSFSKSSQSEKLIIEIFWFLLEIPFLGPVLLPCFFNLFGVGSFLRKWKTRASCRILKYCSMIILTPIWLVLAALGEASEEFKTRSRWKACVFLALRNSESCLIHGRGRMCYQLDNRLFQKETRTVSHRLPLPLFMIESFNKFGNTFYN